MNGNAEFPTQELLPERKINGMGVQRRPIIMLYFSIHSVLVLKKKKLKQRREVLKFNKTGWWISGYEYLLHTYHAMLVIFLMKWNKRYYTLYTY